MDSLKAAPTLQAQLALKAFGQELTDLEAFKPSHSAVRVELAKLATRNATGTFLQAEAKMERNMQMARAAGAGGAQSGTVKRRGGAKKHRKLMHGEDAEAGSFIASALASQPLADDIRAGKSPALPFLTHGQTGGNQAFSLSEVREAISWRQEMSRGECETKPVAHAEDRAPLRQRNGAILAHSPAAVDMAHVSQPGDYLRKVVPDEWDVAEAPDWLVWVDEHIAHGFEFWK